MTFQIVNSNVMFLDVSETRSRCWYHAIIYIYVYEVETSSNVIDESLKRLCSISLNERHEEQFAEPERIHVIAVLAMSVVAMGIRLSASAKSIFEKSIVPFTIAVKL